MKNNSKIIVARNLLHDKIDFFEANQTIDYKTGTLLAFFLGDHLYDIQYENANIEVRICNPEREISATLIQQPIRLYGELLQCIYDLQYLNPSSAKKEDIIKDKNRIRNNLLRFFKPRCERINITKIETF